MPLFFDAGWDFSALGFTVGSTGWAGSRALSKEDRAFSSDMTVVGCGKRVRERVVSSVESALERTPVKEGMRASRWLHERAKLGARAAD